eukprot:TRINITY_DN11082_c0_g1_i12.p1 TRINITY_DN11082_c0_g1~~TRINITY_DN11082_c0_g1_i12.p1  ORF type:complete len:491 (+),score=170.33 TRINITY_DN11082_c0_g1_i12:230-1702(+)
MKWIALIVFLALLQPFALADSDVLTLTDITFDGAIKDNPYIMVLFFASWCGHCKAFSPKYEEAATKIKAEGLPFVLAKLNADEHRDIGEKEGVTSYPTIKFYVHGNPVEYEGERTADDVINFLKKKSRPPSVLLQTKEDILKVKEEKGRRCILGSLNEEALKVYEDIGKNEDHYIFYHAKPEVLKEVFPEIAEGNVLLLKDYDEGKALYVDKMETGSFKEFLEGHQIPLAGEIDKLSIDAVFNPHSKAGVLLFRNPGADESKKLDAEFKEVASELKAKDLVFMLVDINSEWGTRIADHFVIEDSNLPVFEITKTDDDGIAHRFRHTGKLNKQEMKQFIENWRQGKAERFYKSEPEPDSNDGPVYKVVGSNFQKLVIDNDDDVLLYYHAPWCKRCKTVVKTFEKLADSLSEFKKLKFMEVDGHKNDLKEYDAQDYPEVKMYRGKNKKEVIKHDGAFSEYALAVFIKSTASHTVDIPELRAKDEGERNKDDL